MPVRVALPSRMLMADRLHGSVDTVWDEIRSLAKDSDFRVVCAFAAIGLAASLAFASATSNWSAALLDQAVVEAPTGAQIDPFQIMTDSKDLPAAHYDDYSVVFK
jgi:hypothetical protein